MSNVDPKVHSFSSFKEQILPIIADHGYNVIQIMAVL